jgi:hypothetical protein
MVLDENSRSILVGGEFDTETTNRQEYTKSKHSGLQPLNSDGRPCMPLILIVIAGFVIAINARGVLGLGRLHGV